MKFRKIAAVLAGAVMLTSTVALAAAANYPTPFVSSGKADVAIVYGSNAANTDLVAALEINSDLTTKLAAQTATGGTVGTATTSGDVVSLDTSASRIWLNTTLATAKSTLTKLDLPIVLADNTFSGNVDSKLTSTIKVGANKVVFDNQPTSSDDPVLGIAMGASTDPLYNATVSMPAVNFTHSDSEGETIKLFGREFVISTATDSTKIVLFRSAQEIALSAGAADSVTSQTVTIGETAYTVQLVTGTSTTATVAVNGESREINEGASRKIGGIEVAVKSVTESTALNTVTATLLVGSEKLTLQDGTNALLGSDDDPIDGTLVEITGGTGATTEISIAVYKPSSSEDAILAGQSFVDPVFGSFKVDFAGMSDPLNNSARETIILENSGDKAMALTMLGKTFDIVYNNSGRTFLADANNYTIAVREMANLSENKYIMVGNEDYGHLLQVTRIYNNTGTDYTKDAVSFKDVITGDTYNSAFTAEGTGTLTVQGKQYVVYFNGSGDEGTARLKYPTSDSANINTYIAYPTIKTTNNAKVALYEPLLIDLGNFDGQGNDLGTLRLPDGDGYTDTTFVKTAGGGALNATWTISGAGSGVLNTSAASAINLTIGRLIYNLASTVAGGDNMTTLRLLNPGTNATITGPAIVVFEGRDYDSDYEVVVVDVEPNTAGTSTDGIGVNSVGMTSNKFNTNKVLKSDSDFTQYIDWWGTSVMVDADDSDQKTATISYPTSQVYAQVYAGEVASTVVAGTSTGGTVTALGSVAVSDAEVSSVSSKNLIVIGGNCVNSVAAKLLGTTGASCGADFETKTGVVGGQFLIETLASPYSASKVATLVAGRYAADTTNAAKYLTTQTVDTAAGKKYKGTSATVATLVTTTA